MKIKDAISQGYHYCMVNEGEYLIKVSDVLFSPEEYTRDSLFLCEPEPQYVTVSDDEIADMIQEKVENQEDFYSDDIAAIALEGTDELLKALSDKINANFARKPFYNQSNIKLEW